MNIFNTYSLKKILLVLMWLAIGSVSVVLLAAAIHKKDAKKCKGIEIEISGVNNNFFIGRDDILDVIHQHTGKIITGKSIDAFNLVAIEKALKNEIWIRNAELFFDNNDVLQARVNEREPIARIFTSGGNSFYIDSTKMMLPLSDKISARLPMFTNFPTEAKVLSKPDSNLLEDIRSLSLVIQRDSFLMAMIDQVAINGHREFEMVPKIGEQLIIFGDAKDAEQKFNKLRLFYKKVIPRYGWGRYSVINLDYKGQVVAKIKGADDVSADSLRTIQIMQAIASYTSKMASDTAQTIVQDNVNNSTDVSLILQSLQRDEETEQPGMIALPEPIEKNIPVPSVKPAAKIQVATVKKPVMKISKPVIKKASPVVKTSGKKIEVKPKVVMPSKNKNEY